MGLDELQEVRAGPDVDTLLLAGALCAMRRSTWNLCFLAAVFSTHSATAQLSNLTAPHSLSMEAKVTSSGGDTDCASGLKVHRGGKPLGGGWVTATTKNYSQTRARDSAIGLDVEVRNLARVPESARLEWYFYQEQVDGEGGDEIFDAGAEDVVVLAGGTSKLDLQSAAVHSVVTRKLRTTNAVKKNGQHTPPSATVKKSGTKVAGWIVRLVVDGAPLVVRASSPTLEKVGQTDMSLGVKAEPGKKKKK